MHSELPLNITACDSNQAQLQINRSTQKDGLHVTDIACKLRLRPRPSTYPNLQLDSLVVLVDGFNFEVDAHRADKGGGEGVVCVAEQERRLAHTAVADDQQFEHIVKVLVSPLPLSLRVLGGSHLQTQQGSVWVTLQHNGMNSKSYLVCGQRQTGGKRHILNCQHLTVALSEH